MKKQFREAVEMALKKRPFKTKAGQVEKDLVDTQFGYRGGIHETGDLWVYKRKDADLEMIFAFYSNFTEDDLICKVIAEGDYPSARTGASVQFNADQCIEGWGGTPALVHPGKITVGRSISRNDLESSINSICPKEMRLAGIDGNWPVKIGTITDISDLVDRLFVYVYCIEQAKRNIRGENPLALIVG